MHRWSLLGFFFFLPCFLFLLEMPAYIHILTHTLYNLFFRGWDSSVQHKLLHSLSYITGDGEY